MEMNLVVDIGNTLVKLAVFKQNLLVHFKLVTEFDSTVIENLFHEFQCSNIIFSNTRNSLSTENLNISPKNSINFTYQTKIPIQNKYQSPETLGMDRLAAVIGAQAKFPNQNTLVIDAGTCITYDFVDEFGNYFGGAISPGLQMRFSALHHFTGKLPKINFNDFKENRLIGRSTNESIISGVVNGLAFEIEGFIDKYSVYENLNVLITGGDHEILVKVLKNNIFATPFLVLEGLNEVLNFNSTNIVQ